MLGEKNFMAKAIGLFMNCDKIVGGQFEEGLAQMKIWAEVEAQANQPHTNQEEMLENE